MGIDRDRLTPGVFIDRDGVINHPVVRNGKPYPPDSPEKLQLCDGADEAIEILRDPVFARSSSRISRTSAQEGKRAPRSRRSTPSCARLRLDDIRVCYHTDADACDCRKPKPGMLLAAAADWRIDLKRSFMVGDRWRDIEAGRAAGCRTVLVGAGYDERPATGFDVRVDSLLDASRWIASKCAE